MAMNSLETGHWRMGLGKEILTLWWCQVVNLICITVFLSFNFCFSSLTFDITRRLASVTDQSILVNPWAVISIFSKMFIICGDDTTASSRTSLPQSQNTVCWVCAGEKLPQGSRAGWGRIPTPVGWHDVYLPSLTALKLRCLTIAQHKFPFLRHTGILNSQIFVYTGAVFNPWGL